MRKPQAPRPLTPKQHKFVDAYMAGKSGRDAAVLAGFSPQNAMNRAHKLLHKNKSVMAEIEARKAVLKEKSEYDALAAMAELDAGIEFARATKNATAYMRAVELKAKLSGLLIEKNPNGGNASFSININGLETVATAHPTITVEG